VAAHIVAVGSDPPADARVPQPVGDVSVTFDAALAATSRLEVVDASFHRVDQGPTRVDDGTTLSVAVDPGALGWLTVQYQAVAVADGHVASGSYALEVIPPAPAGGLLGLVEIALTLLVAVALASRAIRRRRRASSVAALLGLAVVALASCSSGTQATTPVTSSPQAATVGRGVEQEAVPAEGEVGGITSASVVLAASDLATGPARFAFALLDENGALIENADVGVTFFRLEGEAALPESSQQAEYYPGVVEKSGLYVTRVEFATGGLWGAELRPRTADGELPAQRVRFEVAPTSRSPAVGNRPPATDNPTVDPQSATAENLAVISSDPNPDPDLYAMTVDEAAASGRPTVVVFATPGHCQTELCQPVLDEVKRVKQSWGDRVNFLHIEVYGAFDPLVLSPLMDTWGLNTEPWVFVMDEEGNIADRLEGNVTAAELEPIVAALAGPAS
jgi:methionine-rich copper-binding protein CopC